MCDKTKSQVNIKKLTIGVHKEVISTIMFEIKKEKNWIS